MAKTVPWFVHYGCVPGLYPDLVFLLTASMPKPTQTTLYCRAVSGQDSQLYRDSQSAKQEFGSPSLQPSPHCQTHAFLLTHFELDTLRLQIVLLKFRIKQQDLFNFNIQYGKKL
jgi:hypothetical protein